MNFEGIDSEGEKLLFIEPLTKGSSIPVIDDITRKMAASFAKAEKFGPTYRGWHTCKCGAHSSNTDYKLPNGMIINSLAVHYVAMHRDEVPQEMLDKVSNLTDGEMEPTSEVIQQKS